MKVSGLALGDISIGGMGVTVGIGVGTTHAVRMAIENKIPNICRTVLPITIPPNDLGSPKSFVQTTIALFRVNFNRIGKVIFIMLMGTCP